MAHGLEQDDVAFACAHGFDAVRSERLDTVERAFLADAGAGNYVDVAGIGAESMICA